MDNKRDKDRQAEPDRPPVDGPSGGEAGAEEEETGASSQGKPGGEKSEGKQSPN
ncbi:MAG: hypothetical protein M3280_13865 [Actinomycetota bacterium]|nr:hypothetical protein [Actinomycetota bacterium]